jgi:hypothetical protein
MFCVRYREFLKLLADMREQGTREFAFDAAKVMIPRAPHPRRSGHEISGSGD